jgi:DNA-binding NtrC family response regulator
MCEQQPDTRVIFTTGYTPTAKELMFVIEKGASILTKPYTLISLSQIIRGALEQELTSRSTISVG